MIITASHPKFACVCIIMCEYILLKKVKTENVVSEYEGRKASCLKLASAELLIATFQPSQLLKWLAAHPHAHGCTLLSAWTGSMIDRQTNNQTDRQRSPMESEIPFGRLFGEVLIFIQSIASSPKHGCWLSFYIISYLYYYYYYFHSISL